MFFHFLEFKIYWIAYQVRLSLLHSILRQVTGRHSEMKRKFPRQHSPDGHYEFVRTPFGLRNAPSQFCRVMQILLGQYKFVSVYLDDITIHSKTFSEHIDHIKTVLTVLRRAKLMLNKKKCAWLALSIKLLGHIVSGGTVKMEPAKIKAILERQPPTNQNQVQEFLGLPYYYRHYIQDYAHITYPANNLLKKHVKFNCDAECNIAFQNTTGR
jgi:hypothetical protein